MPLEIDKMKYVGTAQDALARVMYAVSAGTASAYPLLVDGNGNLKTINLAGLVPKEYDQIYLTYSGTDIATVSYSNNSVTISTLTLTYTGTNLTKIVRT